MLPKIHPPPTRIINKFLSVLSCIILTLAFTIFPSTSQSGDLDQLHQNQNGSTGGYTQTGCSTYTDPTYSSSQITNTNVGSTLTNFGNTNTPSSSTPPSCADLGYNLSSANDKKKKCMGSFFTCPFDAAMFKCDEIARAGDIKYSSKRVEENGWVLADGRELSNVSIKVNGEEVCTADKTELGAKKIFSTTANNVVSYTLPDYIGRYLRGMGSQQGDFRKTTGSGYSSVTLSAASNVKTLQEGMMKDHYHQFKYTRISTNSIYNAKSDASRQARYPQGANAITLDTGGNYLCLPSVILYPMIYVGKCTN